MNKPDREREYSLDKQSSFEDVRDSVDKLNDYDRDVLLSVLEMDKIQRNKYHEVPVKLKICFYIFSTMWFVALLGGSILDVEPLWFRFMLLPLFGVPFSISHVLGIIQYKYERDFRFFLTMSFFIGPIIGCFWGFIVWLIIYYVWKIIS